MIYKGLLRQSGGKHYLEMENGQRHFEDRHIWKGYVHHWIDQKVCVRELSQKDYESNEQILIGSQDIYQPLCRNCYNTILK